MDHPTLAILAGGQGTRMGMPKSLLRIKGQPILAHLLDRFGWPGPTLLVTAPGLEHPPGCERFSQEAVDAVADQGPLRGILTALQASTTSLTLVATVDMPGIEPDQLYWLAHSFDERDRALGVMLQRSDGRERIEPFPCIFRRQAGSLIQARIQAGLLSVHSLISTSEISLLPCRPHWENGIWTNLNHPEDLAKWTSSANGGID